MVPREFNERGRISIPQMWDIKVEFLWRPLAFLHRKSMLVLRISLFRCAVMLILFALPVAAIAGSFRGTIVEGAQNATEPNWIYVQGRNGMIRRVEITTARVEYDASVSASVRRHKPQNALTAGAEVRVTAEQGSDGEWRATRIEVLEPADSPQDSPTPPKVTN
jgi:hypothetical protein